MRTPCFKLLEDEWPESITPHDVRQTCLTPAWQMRKLLCASCFAQVLCASCSVCKLLCASCSGQGALRKLLWARCSAQTGLCKLACTSCSAQVAWCKLLCASCSRQGALRKLVGASWSAQVALCNLLCASCSAQVALCKLHLATPARGPGRNRTRDPPVPGAGEFLNLDHADPCRGSRGNFRNRKKPRVFAPRPRRSPQRVARAC